jgi:hypothetical protein
MIENKRQSRQESLMKFLAAIIRRPGAHNYDDYSAERSSF